MLYAMLASLIKFYPMLEHKQRAPRSYRSSSFCCAYAVLAHADKDKPKDAG